MTHTHTHTPLHPLQKSGLASPTNIAALIHAVAHFYLPFPSPPEPPTVDSCTEAAFDSFASSMQHHQHRVDTAQTQQILLIYRANSAAHIAEGTPLHEGSSLHTQANRHPQWRVRSLDSLHLASLLLKACTASLQLFSLNDLLVVVQGAATLGCSCLPLSRTGIHTYTHLYTHIYTYTHIPAIQRHTHTNVPIHTQFVHIKLL